VTQLGNGRRFILDGNTDRSVYLDLLKQSFALHSVAMMGRDAGIAYLSLE